MSDFGRHRGWLLHMAILMVGVVAAYGLSMLFTPSPPESLTRFSALLQFFGVLAVAKGMSDLRRDLSLPSVWQEMLAETKDSLRSLFGRPGKKCVDLGPVSISGRATFRAGAVVTGNTNAPVEQRLAHLEAQVLSLQDGLNGVWTSLDVHKEEVKNDLQATRKEAALYTDQLWNRVRDLSAGGLRLETVGLAWVAVGSLLPALPVSCQLFFFNCQL